jgi:putative membrane protein
MPSDLRLHPVSLLFDLVKHLKSFALPALLLIFGVARTSRSEDWNFGVPAGAEVWLLALLIPAVVASVARYVSFRLRYDENELVIRSGLLFRNERHVPFSRIQNLDAVQNVFHRLFGVVEIRVETGGGKDEEARLSVLPRDAFNEMRRRVFADRKAAPGAAPHVPAEAETTVERAVPQTKDTGEVLLHMPLGEVLLCGLLENKGLVIIGAAYGALWETGFLDRLWIRLFGTAETFGRGFFRDVLAAMFAGRPLPLRRIAIAMAIVAGLLLLVRAASMAWALLRLYDFRLTRVDEDLRAEFGLFTRITATIPLRRVQTVTIRSGPLYRWLQRATVRVQTAGGAATQSQATRERDWLAPLISVDALPSLLCRIVPGFDLTAVTWQPVHPGAFRRAIKPKLILIAAATLFSVLTIGWGAIGVLLLTMLWALISARKYVASLGWAEYGDVVLMRSGWIRRQLTLARVNKIQVVTLHESPFDRRAFMARLRVDTAGGGEFSHRVDIPYLDREVARVLAGRLAAQAASTAFRW